MEVGYGQKRKKTPPPAEDPKDKSGDGGGEEAGPPAKRSKLKLIIIIVAAMALGGGGVFAALKIFGSSSAPPAETAETSAPAAPQPGTDSENPISAPDRGDRSVAAPADGHGSEGGEGLEAQGPRNVEFKPFIVNLNDAGGKRFLKLTMSVEAETEGLETEINNKMPQFRDIILLLLSSLSYDDISTLDGKMRLRSQMLNRINSHLSSGKVRNIYFSEFVVQ